jgi:hypothetical protein
VRTPNLNTVFYSPSPLPNEIEATTKAYLESELRKIALSIQALAAGHFDKTYVAPTKPRDGDIRYADGTSWNPLASGAGIYWFNGSVWAKL